MIAEAQQIGKKEQLKQKIYQELLQLHKENHQRFLQKTRKKYIQLIKDKISGGQPPFQLNNQPHQEKMFTNQYKNQGIDRKFKSPSQQEQSHPEPSSIDQMPAQENPTSSKIKQQRQTSQKQQVQDLVFQKQYPYTNEHEDEIKRDPTELSQNISSSEQRASESDDEDMVMWGQDQFGCDDPAEKKKKEKSKKPKAKVQKKSNSVPEPTLGVLKQNESLAESQTKMNTKQNLPDLDRSKQNKQDNLSDEESIMMMGQDQISGNTSAAKPSKKKQMQQTKVYSNMNAKSPSNNQTMTYRDPMKEKKISPQVSKPRPQKADSDEDMCMNDDEIM